MQMRRCQLIVLMMVATALATGCTRAHARTEPEMPLLEPPPAPPRIVETYVEAPIDAADIRPADVLPAEPAAKVPARPPITRPETTGKLESSRSEPEKPTPSAPALTLKPAPGAETTTASIRDLLSKASRDLGRVNYAGLDADGRVQYDTARGFMRQAEEALKSGNLVFAGKLADKAATMAAVLVR